MVCVVCTGAWTLYAWRFDGLGWWGGDAESASIARQDAAPDAGGDRTLLRASTPNAGVGPSNAAPDPQSPIRPSLVMPSALARSATANRPASIRGGGSGQAWMLGMVDASSAEDAAGAFDRGRAALEEGDFIAARAALSSALDCGLSSGEESSIRFELKRIADALTFSRAIVTDDSLAARYVVQSQDTLGRIAARFRVTPDLLARINRLANPDSIGLGAPLKVLHGPFHAVIDKSDHRLYLYLSDALVDSFQVGLGTNGGTPTGVWIVRNKLKNPEWTDPTTGLHYLADDPQNPIGERWIGLEGVAGEALGRTGFGIHGTIDPASIGENVSMGCIRLVAADVSLVFDMLIETHSQVVIRP